MGLLEGIAKIHRAWLEVEPDDHGPSLLLPTYAKGSSIELSGDSLSLQLNPCPERDALLQGYCWRQAATNFVGMFAGEITGSLSQLKPMGQGYSLDASDLLTCKLQAYATRAPVQQQLKKLGEGRPNLKPTEQAQVVEVLPTTTDPAKLGHSQIIALPNAQVYASPDLIGQTLRLRVAYQQVILIDNGRKIASLRSHLVCTYKTSPGKFWYTGLPNCSFSVDCDRITLKWRLGNEILESL